MLILQSPRGVQHKKVEIGSALELPLRQPRKEDGDLGAFGELVVPETSGQTTLVAGTPERKVYEWDVAKQALRTVSGGDGGRWRLNATGTEVAMSWHEVTEIDDHDPTSAKIVFFTSQSYTRGGLGREDRG